ncbi:hypothetical protein NBRC10512_007655 [Rhodotorula toruloides]|uniref:Uncharacterized protein n=1 Tax=Rhodotorula toruloides (strain NP11) TaxID=1130832 RepID=M7XAK5_RHOT1|nr:uncharacterized protein RHTO_02369 [Rhodotorula toruloides NP11]EMS20754.1 hypothetical protein RHTO_02369 [Rhodotorula toruloides NP11]
MALRRPPTAVSLQPSDVADLRAFISQRDASTTKGKGGDEVVEREKREREEREKKGTKARVVGGGSLVLTELPVHLLEQSWLLLHEAAYLSAADTIKCESRPTSDRPTCPRPVGTLPVPPPLPSPRSYAPDSLARISIRTSGRTEDGRGSQKAAGAGMQPSMGTALRGTPTTALARKPPATPLDVSTSRSQLARLGSSQQRSRLASLPLKL